MQVVYVLVPLLLPLHQLELLLGKELAFLNDFEYDEDAKKWCGWQYLKRFLEGEPLSVARPKNRGGNQDFDSDAPVFFTAPQEISLYRGRKRDDYETSQMANRVKYTYMSYIIPGQQRKEVDPCGYCGAKLYLEGDSQASSSQTPPPAMPPAGSKRTQAQTSQPSAPGDQGTPKKVKTGMDMLSALKDLQDLKEKGLLDTPQAKGLKEKILRGE